MVATAASLLSRTTADAQNKVTVRLVMSSFNRESITDQMISDFETAHPNIAVDVVKYDPSIPDETSGQSAYYSGLQTWVSQGDVLYVDQQRTAISPSATQAGYFLDLAPLAVSDSTLNSDDFYPTVWNAFQWDKGLWALPVSTDVQILTYDPTAFDNAGLAYPDTKWTLADLAAAVDKLTVKNSSNAVTTAGLSFSGPGAGSYSGLLRSLYGNNFFDNTTVPNVPKLDSAASEALLDAWVQLEKSGEVGNGQNNPISIMNISNMLRGPGNSNSSRKAMLLPGGKAVLTVQGFAVSGGTQHPQEAYTLAAYLTTQSGLASFGSVASARKSLTGTQQSGGPGPTRNISADLQAVITNGIANGLTPSDMRYTNYLQIAVKDMQANGTVAAVALQTAETQANTDLQAGVSKKSNNVINVATPVPVQALPAGKIQISFGMTSFVSPMPNQDKWDAVIKDFTSSDPQVASIAFDTTTPFGFDSAISKYDCFYLPYNSVPSLDLSKVVNLDPYFTADSSFDKSDIANGILTQLQRDNKTWAYPIVIQPTILRYSVDAFSKANLQAPTSNFTIATFNDDMKALHLNSTDSAAFSANNSTGTALLILIADYGGLPLDYRTNPPTIDFTSQASVDAIKQVLDLAKGGYIQYNALSALDFGGGRASLQTAMYSDVLNGLNFGPQRAPSSTSNGATTYKPASYPTGTTYTAVSYSIGTAYISASAKNPEACYRWLTTLAQHPELFDAMPARRSLLSASSLASSQGADVVNLYQQVDTLLNTQNVITLPSLQGIGGSSPSVFLLQHWLFEAFDNYVQNGADLASGLKDAENYAKTFQACTATIPAYDPSTQNQGDYNKAFMDCATKADSRLKSTFGG
jgi:multiple sugar transport system substrate-binding protein